MRNSIQTLDLALFSLFIILSMLALINCKNKFGWFLSTILFAFLISYMTLMFINGETLIRFILIVLNVLAFLFSVLAVGRINNSGKNHKLDETVLLKKELAELAEERKAAEQEFSNMIENEEDKVEEKEIQNLDNKPKKTVKKTTKKKTAKKTSTKKVLKNN